MVIGLFPLYHSIVRILLLLLSLQATAPAPPEQLRASLITIGPGEEVYERFGHNMVRIQDPSKNIDAVFNWGIFDFDQPNFVFNFIQGRMWYMMMGGDAKRTIEMYRTTNRDMWEQELNLSPAQVQALLDFCIWNDRDENRGYRYDYYQDNCSTRVRDALDLALGGQIQAKSTTQPSAVTFRSETNRLMATDLPLYISLDYVLAQPTDRPITAWQEMFIPMRLRERLNALTITDQSGAVVPLVRKETVLGQSRGKTEYQSAPNRIVWFGLVGIMFGGAIFGLARSIKGKGPAKWGFILLVGFWSLLSGFAGLLAIYLWTLTDHAAARFNENILQLNPLLLPLVILVPLALRAKAKNAKMAIILAGMGLGGSILGLLLQVLPMMDQVNGNMIALAVPINTGLFMAIWMLDQRLRATPQAEKRSSK